MKEFLTAEYHGKGDLDSGLTKRVGEGWAIQAVTVTQARCAWGLLLGLVGFWLFERHNVFHVTYGRGAS